MVERDGARKLSSGPTFYLPQLRTSVDAKGMGKRFGHLKMPDYRWGIFFSPSPSPIGELHSANTRVNPFWREVPGEHRGRAATADRYAGATLRPASVEQQRPPRSEPVRRLYDLRNLFSRLTSRRARHLWAMVYLLHAYFGPRRTRGSRRLVAAAFRQCWTIRAILGAFNERTPDWLSFFMFCAFHRFATASISSAVSAEIGLPIRSRARVVSC